MKVTPTDLFAFGSKGIPRPPRRNIDLFPDLAGMIGPESPNKAHGASLLGDPYRGMLKGNFHLLPAGTVLPDDLDVVADGPEVDPHSLHDPTHHTLYPAVAMSFDRFVELFNALPWKWAGRK